MMPPENGHLPEFESDQHAEWRIRDGDVLVLRYDRRTGAWTGEREQPDPRQEPSAGHKPCRRMRRS